MEQEAGPPRGGRVARAEPTVGPAVTRGDREVCLPLSLPREDTASGRTRTRHTLPRDDRPPCGARHSGRAARGGANAEGHFPALPRFVIADTQDPADFARFPPFLALAARPALGGGCRPGPARRRVRDDLPVTARLQPRPRPAERAFLVAGNMRLRRGACFNPWALCT